MSPALLDRWRARSLLLRPDGTLWDGEQQWADFEAWCACHPGMRCRLWLASALLHELVCDADLPLPDDAAVLAWARPLLQHYHGEAALAWPLAAWQQGRRRGACALHGASLEALRSSAHRHRVRLLGVSPWWSLVLRQALRRQPVLRQREARLLVVEGPRITAIGLESGTVAAIAVRRLQSADAASLHAWSEQSGGPRPLAVGYGIAGDVGQVVMLPDPIDGEAPAARWLHGALA